MAVMNLFSKRQRRLRGDVPDVYAYDSLPDHLRVQVVQLWQEALGPPYWPTRRSAIFEPNRNEAAALYDHVVDALRRERGVFRLGDAHDDPATELARYFLTEASVELALDVVEIMASFAMQEHHVDELNQRFREHGVGYHFEAGQLIRVDSQLVHREVVLPSLRLVHREGFEGPEQEFLRAHEHYRHRRYKECLNECLKAFESTMKAIFDARGWRYDGNAPARKLIKVCFEKALVPSWMEAKFAGLRQLLESSVPTVRNKTSGHGQGKAIVDVPSHLAAYGLHMTASTIIFLIEANQALDP